MSYTDHLISAGIGIAVYFLSLWIHRAWSSLSVKDLQRRIKEYEASKEKLDNLSKSDRALIIHGFQALFAMIAILCLMFAVQTGLFLHPESYEYDVFVDYRELAQILLWLIPALISIGFIISLQQIADHPKSIDKIERKIAKLKDKLSGKGQ